MKWNFSPSPATSPTFSRLQYSPSKHISMGFASDTSQRHAETTVNKLFRRVAGENHIKTGQERSRGAGQTTGQKPGPAPAQQVNEEITRTKHQNHGLRATQAQKQKERKKIGKAVRENHKFSKQVKYQIIKKHAAEQTLTEEENKYLQKLVKKNVRAVKRVADIEDEDVAAEIAQLRREILAYDQGTKKSSRENKNKSKKDFNTKIKKGVVAYPGLTPGLAPVGLDESEEEE